MERTIRFICRKVASLKIQLLFTEQFPSPKLWLLDARSRPLSMIIKNNYYLRSMSLSARRIVGAGTAKMYIFCQKQAFSNACVKRI